MNECKVGFEEGTGGRFDVYMQKRGEAWGGKWMISPDLALDPSHNFT
jgi:hypothetical protein